MLDIQCLTSTDFAKASTFALRASADKSAGKPKLRKSMKKVSIILIILVILAGVWLGLKFLIGESSPETRTINLYYYNPDLDKDESGNIACGRDGLVPVEREISITQTPIQDAIKLLLSSGLIDLEGVSLRGASLNDGILTLEFDDPNNKTVGGACRVGILWFQIEATAKQFPEVRQVRFLPEELFQP